MWACLDNSNKFDYIQKEELSKGGIIGTIIGRAKKMSLKKHEIII